MGPDVATRLGVVLRRFDSAQTRRLMGLPVRTAEKRPGVIERGSMGRQSYGSPMGVWDSILQ